MEGSAAVAHQGSMSGMPISRSKNEQTAFFTSTYPPLMRGSDDI